MQIRENPPNIGRQPQELGQQPQMNQPANIGQPGTVNPSRGTQGTLTPGGLSGPGGARPVPTPEQEKILREAKERQKREGYKPKELQKQE